MASTASTSAQPAQVTREAGPLPRKIGEFGYSESQQSLALQGSHLALDEVDLSDRHPADTPWPANARANANANAAAAAAARSNPSASTTSLAASTSTASDSRAAATVTARNASPIPPKRDGWFHRLTSSSAPPLVAGLHGPSILRLLFILACVGATIAGWVFTVQRLNAANHDPPPGTPVDGSSQPSSETVAQMTGAMFIFVHIAFAIALLLELVFAERAVYRLRAERWRFLHPGEALPRRDGSGGGMPLAPWNRPPLPTYAAALGLRGTGDVEDAAIAVPPPPEYGNTRGSTLLLASFMPAGLRRASARSQLSQVPESRPISYRERDEEAEGISDAIRARQLEMALARLEEGGQPAQRRS